MSFEINLNQGTSSQQKTSRVKDETTKPEPAQKIPSPEPAGLGAEYDRLWRQAWRLADWVDDPDGPPLEDRLARLPELDRLHDRMLEIVRRQHKPVASENWSEFSAVGRVTNGKGQHAQDYCPARCRRSGLCFGRIYFEGGPERGTYCDPKNCKYQEALAEWHERKNRR